MIDFAKELNEAQLEAAMTTEGPVLVIAGAGSGKTRTVVYRLAHLAERGVDPRSILLLTFTRKASQEMLTRAQALSEHRMHGVNGGTFHSFAYLQLRMHAGLIGYGEGFTVMDRGDQLGLVGEAKEALGLGKGDRSFPKKETVLEIIGKGRNKELALDEVMRQEAWHLSAYADDIRRIGKAYEDLKARHSLVDYDDLLFIFERLLVDEPDVREMLQERYRYVMVDEYQDTNRVQARLVRLLSGLSGNVMAVGDDAQSIYAFRGANVANILDFPKIFPGTKVIRLERNYRSTQPILDLSNAVLANAAQKFDKRLYTERQGGEKPRLVRALSDSSQAQIAVSTILEFAREHPLHEIAVLFRAGYQSFAIEVALSKLGMKFQKFGGIRFSDAAHIKDVLSYLRLLTNAADRPAWQRVLGHIKGVGPKTAQKIMDAVLSGDPKALAQHKKRYDDLAAVLGMLDELRARPRTPSQALDYVMTYYTPVLIRDFADDYPRRQQGIEQLARIASAYKELDQFLGDMSLENPEDEERGPEHDAVVLSTIHSAKGLEWKAVILIDLVEDRFPSKRAMQRPEDLEEERRLMYVACTRAEEHLVLVVPEAVYVRHLERSDPVRPSPFVMELPRGTYDEYKENYIGGLSRMQEVRAATARFAPESEGGEGQPAGSGAVTDPRKLGYVTHKSYGRGKIVQHIPPNKYRVNFPGFGLKVMLEQFLEFEAE